MSRSFSWERFNLKFIQSICYSEKTRIFYRPKIYIVDKLCLLPYIDRICSRPDEHFVRLYRTEITDNFLAEGTHLVSIMKVLQRNNYRGVTVGSMEEMLTQFKRLRLTSTVIKVVLAELHRFGRAIEEVDLDISIFTTPKIIDLVASVPSEIKMREYQDEAINKLNEHFLDNDKRAGVLAMPTGSGKTRVATKFLLESMVAQGWQIVWLTHRAMLIEQVADSIYKMSGSALKGVAKDKKTFKMVCVSGEHSTIKATEKDDDVMIYSVQSLVRNLEYLQAILNDKVMIIVDESHHTEAKSYRVIIKEIQKQVKNVKLLGLTATPVRMTEVGTARLMNLFDNSIIYSIPMSELIAKGYLSEPCYTQIDTNIDFKTTISIDEEKYIRKWGELSSETVEKMADMVERNKLIVDTYLQNKEKYGKTLMFALNGTHCRSLCEELVKHGVRCDYIYSRETNNKEKISKFQQGELDVLVNIQILTEGSDVPDIQTIFLTRPTTSDVLLMQMIGRGMRGVESGGTKTVNIVDFHDIWGSFTHWLNPQFIWQDREYNGDETKSSLPELPVNEEKITWEMIRDILDGITAEYKGLGEAGNFLTLPVGWYDVFDEDGLDTKVLVFESQVAGYVAMLKNKKLTIENQDYTGSLALKDWFRSFGLLPSERDLQLVIDMYRKTGEFPILHQFKERYAIEPTLIAKKFKEENVGLGDFDSRVSEIYQANEEIIKSIYEDQKGYRERVLQSIVYPDGSKAIGGKIEEMPEELLPFDCNPVYDLKELVEEVVNERFDGLYGEVPEVSWTNKYYSTYFGCYYYREKPFIHINSILNSESVPREVVKYVIYHELLHRDNDKHDKAFRAMEHQYPNWTEHERFLDFKFPKFDLRYAM